MDLRAPMALLLLASCATSRSEAPAPAPAAAPAPPEDPYLWLEEVAGEKALAWVQENNQVSLGELAADPAFEPLRTRLLSILDARDRIPFVTKQGTHFYNFWRDDQHPRGVWRRVRSLAEYRKAAPAWETVLDLDALATEEKENWVWKGAVCLYPKYERCLLQLSRGGADATVVREFDVPKKRFLDGGFTLPEAKTDVAWKDLDTIYVGTDLGPGTLTDSGYPRLVKEWKRGTPIASATTVYEGQKTDVAVGGMRWWDHGRVHDLVVRAVTFFEQEWFLRRGEALVKVEVPISANIDTFDDQLLVRLRDDWTVGGKTWPAGSFLATDLEGFLKGGREFTALYTPSPRSSFNGSTSLKTGIVVSELEDVHDQLYFWTRSKGRWTRSPIPTGGLGNIDVSAVETHDSDEVWFTTTGFTRPTTLSIGRPAKKLQELKTSPSYFDAAGLKVEQHFATSKDGTRVPYFQVSREKLAMDGQSPTLLTGYGGFEVSLEPGYNPLVGAGWLEKGGTYVVANIRGGGEYGPSWHQAALKLRRQNAYDDFIAVAEDLVARKVTSPAKLGIQGGSNGGLLVGVMLTQRPELFGAVVCQVPLLDMKRYHLLLAGASWMGEYGNPDVPEEWAALARFSPYQNVKPGVKYPRTFFTTSTRDDRVHPGHARKMVARMQNLEGDVLYYENVEGGHGGAANNEQKAFMTALAYTFLARQLGLER